MDPLTVALIIVAVLAGIALGWFFGSRPAADWKARHVEREAEAKELTEKLKEMTKDLATMSERAAQTGSLLEKLDRNEEARRLAENALASLRSEGAEREKSADARYHEREKHFERELKRLAEAEEKLQAKFNEIGEKLLDGAQTKFLESAHARLEVLNKESLAELEKKVGPVGQTLERYRLRIEEIEKGRAEAYHQLQGVIGEVRAGQ